MTPLQDQLDLRQFARDGDREALNRLVKRYIDFIYGVACREMGNSHAAEDVAQAVILIFARRAHTIHPAALSSWLFTTTRHVAANARKSEARRRHHERRAAGQTAEHTMSHAESLADDEHVHKHLNAALAAQAESDRRILLMRFSQDLEISQISELLGITDVTARKRINRAIERMRRFLTGKGVVVGSAAIGTAIGSVSKAAPAGLLSAAGSASLSASSLAKTTAAAISWAPYKIAAILILVLGFTGGIATYVWRAMNRIRPVVPIVAAPVVTALDAPALSTVVHSGSVTGPDGKALAGVRVWSMLDAADPARVKLVEAETVTDASGHYTLPPITSLDSIGSRGRYDYVTRTLLFDHPSYALAWREKTRRDVWADPSASSEEPVQVQLEAPAELKVKVIDAATHQPVAGAAVQLRLQATIQLPAHSWKYEYFNLPMSGQTIKTDDQGMAVFKRLPGSVRAEVKVIQTSYARYPDFDAGYGDYDALPARPSDVPFIAELKPGGQIRLRPAQSDHPLPHAAEVLAVPKSKFPMPIASNWISQEPDGSLILSGLEPGRYDLVMNPFGADAPINGVWMRAENVEVAAGRTTYASIAFGPGRVIGGRLVIAGTQTPVAGYSISARLLAGQELLSWVSSYSDLNGRFELHVLQGPQEMTFENTRESNRTIAVENGAVDLGDIETKAYPIFRGRLADGNGKPVAGGTVIAVNKPYLTGPDGSFSIDTRSSGLVVGSPIFAFNAEHVLGAAAIADEKMMDAAATAAPTITLKVLASVSGQIIEEGGNPVDDTGIEVSIIGKPGNQNQIRGLDRLPWGKIKRDGGKFSFDAPPGLALQIRVNLDQARATVDVDTLAPGELRDVGQLVLQREGNRPTTRPADLGGAITGRIVDDAGGEPVINASIKTDSNPDLLFGPESDSTGHDGTFRLEHLPHNQKIHLTIMRAGYMAQRVQLVTDAAPVTIHLRKAASDLIGKPAPELSVSTWVDGKDVKLADLKGKVVLLDFGMDDWNVAARSHHSTFSAAEKYSDRGLAVLLFNRYVSDRSGRGGRGGPAGGALPTASQTALDRMRTYHLPLPFAMDAPALINVDLARSDNFTLGLTAFRYGVDRAPTIILIDKQGIVRASPDRDHLYEWIEKLLAE